VRLLDVPLSGRASSDRIAVLLRFLRHETEFIYNGGQLTQAHHRTLALTWNRSCKQFLTISVQQCGPRRGLQS
jgi:hypothetical protein